MLVVARQVFEPGSALVAALCTVMGMKLRKPAGSLLPTLQTATLPEQGTFNPLKKQPIALQLRDLDSTVADGGAQPFWIQDVPIDFNLTLWMINESRSHLARRLKHRTGAEILEHQAQVLPAIQFQLQVLQGISR